MTENNFKGLEEKVDELIELCDEMKAENQMLRERTHNWKDEREDLLNKNQMARVRLEKILERLKSLQQNK